MLLHPGITKSLKITKILPFLDENISNRVTLNTSSRKDRDNIIAVSENFFYEDFHLFQL